MVALRSFDQSGLLHAIQPRIGYRQPYKEEKKVLTLLRYSSSVIVGLLLVLLSAFARAPPLGKESPLVLLLNDQTVSKGGSLSKFTLLFFFLELLHSRNGGVSQPSQPACCACSSNTT